jgi:hypothetical protein
MSKRGRKKRKAIRISPESTLRPRLDNLWAEGALLHKDDGAIEEDLDVVARDIAPDFLVETMLRVYLVGGLPQQVGGGIGPKTGLKPARNSGVNELGSAATCRPRLDALTGRQCASLC